MSLSNKKYTQEELQKFFQSLTQDYDVLVPVKLTDGTRSLGHLGDGELSLAGGVLPMKTTGIFAPYLDLLFTFDEGNTVTPPKKSKPSFIVGFTAQDTECLNFIDRFFSNNFRDEHYFAKRDGAVIVCVSGNCGINGQMLKIAERNCDIELVANNGLYIALAYSEVGKSLLAKLTGGVESKQHELDELLSASKEVDAENLELLRKASKLILENKVTDEFWQSIANRCISCTACTLVCPTCTCFDVFDRSTTCNNKTCMARWRLRDSCLLSGFTREASGHNPMEKEFSRTRRRIHHKLAADVTRWGQMTCLLCGRCDMACPSNIGIVSVCKLLVKEFG